MKSLTLKLTGEYEGLTVSVDAQVADDAAVVLPAGHVRNLINQILDNEASMEMLRAQIVDAGNAIVSLGKAEPL